MKKLMTIVLVLCMVLALFSGCMTSPSDDAANTTEASTLPEKNENEEVHVTEPGKDNDKDIQKEEPPKITIEETVIYDENDIIITARSVFETENSFGLTLQLENHSEKTVSFYLSHCLVNGFSVLARYGNMAAGPGEEDRTSISFEKADMEFLGRKYWGTDSIATIAGANAELTIEDNIIPVPFFITTSAGVGYEPTFDDSGDILYEKDGLTVIYKEITETSLGDALTLLVINKTGKDIIIESLDGYVNGSTFGLPLWDYVFSDAISCCHVILDSSSLEYHGIETVETVRFILGITSPETYRLIAKSGEIEITMPK